MTTSKKVMSDENFVKKYESYEKQAKLDIVKELSSTESELSAIIKYIITHRQQIRNGEIERLERESKELIRKLKEKERKKLLEELQCFKDILALQKELMEKDDKPRD